MPELTDTPNENSYTLTATVKSVAQSTEGYGDNLHVVGVKVEAGYVIEIEGEAVSRTLNFVLPLALRRFALPGDKIVMQVVATDEVAPEKES